LIQHPFSKYGYGYLKKNGMKKMEKIVRDSIKRGEKRIERDGGMWKALRH